MKNYEKTKDKAIIFETGFRVRKSITYGKAISIQ